MAARSPGVSKWLVIARNEYRVGTSRIRKVRPYLPYLAVSLLVLHVVFVAPAIVNLFVDDVMSLLSQATAATVQVTLFTLFFYFVIMPIAGTMREVRTGRLEILLAAPIRSSDLLLGEYFGEMPFYAIVIAGLGGLFNAMLCPLGMSGAQVAIVIAIFVVTSLSALWIGIVIAAILRTKLERLAAGKDIGGALAMLTPLPLVAVLYAVWGGGLLQALSNPEATGVAKAVLRFLPSSWGSGLIVQFVSNPGEIAVGEVLIGLGGLVAFFVFVLWVGARVADRAYSLEQISLSTSTVKPDGTMYRAVKGLGGGGSLGILLVSIFKAYTRRLENLSTIVYMLGVLVLINVFLVPDSDPPIQLMTALFLYPILIVMITGGITVDGKENLFIYRKAPSGVTRYLKAIFLRGLLLMIPITGIPTAVIASLWPHATAASALILTGLTLLIVAALVAFVMGLFLINPAFTDKSPRIWLNVFVVVGMQIGVFALTAMILTRGGKLADLMGGMAGFLSLEAAFTWIIGAVIFLLGKRRLEAIE